MGAALMVVAMMIYNRKVRNESCSLAFPSETEEPNQTETPLAIAA
jgi:hypothetical protein